MLFSSVENATDVVAHVAWTLAKDILLRFVIRANKKGVYDVSLCRFHTRKYD